MGEEDITVASLKDLNVCLDPGLQHERIIAADSSSRMLMLTRAIRKQLKQFVEKDEKSSNKRTQSPRVVVFFPTEEEAKEAIEPIRDSLWNEHRVCVLLPSTGFAPERIMEEFKDDKTNLMIATPNSVRGLDFPSLTHVYTMYLPFDDPREYIHLAGRVGRVGQLGSVKSRNAGRVVSIVAQDDVPRMDKLASSLGFTMTDINLTNEEVYDVKLVDELNKKDDDDKKDSDNKEVEEDDLDFSKYLNGEPEVIESDDDKKKRELDQTRKSLENNLSLECPDDKEVKGEKIGAAMTTATTDSVASEEEEEDSLNADDDEEDDEDDDISASSLE